MNPPRATIPVNVRFKVTNVGVEVRRLYRWMRRDIGFERHEANLVVLGWVMGNNVDERFAGGAVVSLDIKQRKALE